MGSSALTAFATFAESDIWSGGRLQVVAKAGLFAMRKLAAVATMAFLVSARMKVFLSEPHSLLRHGRNSHDLQPVSLPAVRRSGEVLLTLEATKSLIPIAALEATPTGS